MSGTEQQLTRRADGGGLTLDDLEEFIQQCRRSGATGREPIEAQIAIRRNHLKRVTVKLRDDQPPASGDAPGRAKRSERG